MEHKQVRRAVVARGGPENYAGRSLRDAYRSLGLGDAQVDQFIRIVDASLVAVGAPAAQAAKVRELLERLRLVIVTPSRPE